MPRIVFKVDRHKQQSQQQQFVVQAGRMVHPNIVEGSAPPIRPQAAHGHQDRWWKESEA